MASIQIELDIAADSARAWDVIGDWADGPVRMAPDFVATSEAHDDVRVVTFADGFVARERLVSRDDSARRIVYSLIGDTARPEHDNAVMQVVSDGPHRCRFVWSRDVLPDEAAGPLRAAMEQAAPIIKSALEYPADQAAAPRRTSESTTAAVANSPENTRPSMVC